MPKLEFFNGLGGFAADGGEYVTVLGEGQWTPAPWINVIANPSFGFQVSAEGAGYTWSINSQQNQITPWSNDPVSDRPGEAFYIRDEDSGELWGPTALPIREETSPYVVRHGQGYSRFEHTSHGIALELLQYVPLEDPDQDLPAQDPKSIATIPQAFGHCLRGMGVGNFPFGFRPVRRDRDRSGNRSHAGAKPLELRVWQPRRLRRSCWTPN